MLTIHRSSNFFFFNDTATTEIYTLSLHDALPISWNFPGAYSLELGYAERFEWYSDFGETQRPKRSEEHTSELQSHLNLVCRLLLEKKKIRNSHCLNAVDSISTARDRTASRSL